MRRVREGAIIGFGNVAANGHLPGWHLRDDLSIVAVADPDPARRALAAQILPAARHYTSADELLDSESLEFVDIATPPTWHTPIIVAAARQGLHILCEKPLATSLRDYRRARAAVQAAGVVLHTVHNWKYSEAFRVTRQQLRAGAIGKLTSMKFETARNGCAVATGDNWRIRPSLAGGGILVDHGWHAFYLMTALAGERPQRIRATLDRQRYIDAEVEDTAHCVIEFASCLADLRLTWAASERRTRWRFTGTDGQLTIDDDRLVCDGRGGRHEQSLATALSAGSHHPEWFSGVVESFNEELTDPRIRGTNQAEAELCVLMLSLAYASHAEGSRPLDIPSRWPEEALQRGDHRPDLPSHGG